MSVQLLSPFQAIIPSTFVCTGVRCVMRGGGGGGGSAVSAAVKVKSLNPLAKGGAQPIMNDQETILVVQKFNTRGLAIKL